MLFLTILVNRALIWVESRDRSRVEPTFTRHPLTGWDWKPGVLRSLVELCLILIVGPHLMVSLVFRIDELGLSSLGIGCT